MIEGQLLNGAGAVGGAWILKETFTFLINWKKSDTEKVFYQPDEKWKEYCTERFEEITKVLNQLHTDQEVMKIQLEHLEDGLGGCGYRRE